MSDGGESKHGICHGCRNEADMTYHAVRNGPGDHADYWLCNECRQRGMY